MKVFVCFDGDHIGREVGRAVMTDDIAAVRRVDQAINAGNELWRSLALRCNGTVIEIGGDEGRIELSAEHLAEVPPVAQQYAGAVGASVSVGIGMKLSESAKALLVAKLRGGNQIVLWHPEMQAELDAAGGPKSEADKIADEYLSKAQPAANTGAGAGFAGHGTPQRPSVMHGQGDHEQGAVIKDMIQEAQENAPPPVEQTHAADDLEDQLHDEASKQDQQDQAEAQKQDGQADQLRAQLAQVLGVVREKSPVIAQLQQVDPEAYQSIMALVQGVIALGREVVGNVAPPSPGAEPSHVQAELDKPAAAPNEMSGSPATQVGGTTAKSAGPIPGAPSHHHLHLPAGSQVNGRVKVTHEDGTESWVMANSGMVQSQDPTGHPASAREPGAR